MFKWIDNLSFPVLIIIAVMLGLAPFFPQPHLIEKLNMLMAGTLVKPLDIFDLLLHAAPIVILIIKITRYVQHNATNKQDK
jgi:hypothetical protein